ncbi:MAG: hypothetical protein JNG88_13430 [Phycisphaerales bacterium]|nr:hypothetical protein [Phycisphaerales bacterium]
MSEPIAVAGPPPIKLRAIAPRPREYFGSALAIHHGAIGVGAWAADAQGQLSGAAFAYDSITWCATPLIDAQTGAGDFFGYSLAALPDVLIVGAPGRDSTGALDVGAAVEFRRDPAGWQPVATLLPPAERQVPGLQFGWAMTAGLSFLGRREYTIISTAGSTVFVFERDAGTVNWNAPLTIEPPPDASADFGRTIAAEHDLIAIVDNQESTELPGRVYLYERGTDIWLPAGTLYPATSAPNDNFGTAVAIQNGTVFASSVGPASDFAGAVSVFDRDEIGVWRESQTLTAFDARVLDYFGDSIGAGDDALLIGAHGDDDHGEGSGAAYLYVRQRESWQFEIKLVPEDGMPDAYFGLVSGVHGRRGLIAAPQDGESGYYAGAVYVYDLPTFSRGDCNCDGLINSFDIDPFVYMLTQQSPLESCELFHADVNRDGAVNVFDIDAFVHCVLQSGCQ